MECPQLLAPCGREGAEHRSIAKWHPDDRLIQSEFFLDLAARAWAILLEGAGVAGSSSIEDWFSAFSEG